MALAGCAGEPEQVTQEGDIDGGAPSLGEGPGPTSNRSTGNGGGNASGDTGDGAAEVRVSHVGEPRIVGNAYFTYVVGEVENQGDEWVGNVDVALTLYGPDGSVVESGSRDLMVDRLAPGERGPYKIPVETASVGGSYDYRVTLTADRPGIFEADVRSFETARMATRTDEFGHFHVMGEVTNTGAKPSTFTQVIMVLYDAEGRVLEADWTTTDPDRIPPGGTASFDVRSVLDDLEPASHRIIVQGD